MKNQPTEQQQKEIHRHTNSQDYSKEYKDTIQLLSLHYLFYEIPQAATGSKANAHTSNHGSGI